jgi:hypothetical protein
MPRRTRLQVASGAHGLSRRWDRARLYVKAEMATNLAAKDSRWPQRTSRPLAFVAAIGHLRRHPDASWRATAEQALSAARDAAKRIEDDLRRVAARDGFHSTADVREGCRMCGLFLQHEHGDGVAAYPY